MINIQQEQKISQQQQLSAVQLQSLSLLSVPVTELQERINEVMNSNPMLEYESFGDSALLSALPDSSIEDERKKTSADDEEDFVPDNENWYDELPAVQDNYENTPEYQQKRDFFFDNITEHESMQQQLMQELNYIELTDFEREIAEALTGGIDESGLLVTPVGDIAQCCNADYEEVEAVLLKLQKIFPPGIGGRDIRESLKLQLEAYGETDEKLFELLDYLEDFGRNRLEYIASMMNISANEVAALGEKIRKLNPHPGNAFSTSKASFVVPELTVKRGEDGFYLQDHEEFLPRIRISAEYSKMLEDPDLPEDTRTYLRSKLQEAEQFRNSLEMREKTIVRIGRFIMENQTEFFEKGMQFLRPMTMAQAAEALGIHETTVSRGCANKYLGTPQGLFEFKFFFSGGFRSSGGEDVSARAVQEKIRHIIENEDPRSPLSDDKISAMLQEQGVKVARRTVAKYREQMNILPTSLRRRRG